MKIVRFSELQFVPSAHEDSNDPGVLIIILLEKDDFIDGKAQMINWAKLPCVHISWDNRSLFIMLP